MRRLPLVLLITSVVSAFSMAALAQNASRPYGPFDAIAEGTRNSESRRLSLIDSQLDQMDRLRSPTIPVAGRRLLVREPDVVGVYPYGRRGILGLRPQGYVVVRRAPAIEYRRAYVIPPPIPNPDIDLYGGSSLPDPARQPIGHESRQSGANRWEYRPLYADEDRFDEVHRDIERNLGPSDDGIEQGAQEARRSDPRENSVLRPTEPEELPEPGENAGSGEVRPRNDLEQARTEQARDGHARDIARQAPSGNLAPDRDDVDSFRTVRRAPPPPQPDPPDQPTRTRPTENAGKQQRTPEAQKPPSDDQLRGPLLQNPNTGTREF